MPKLKKYPLELKERAVRLVLDARDETGGRRGVCTRIRQQLGIPPDTLRGWVQRAEIDEGLWHGVTTDASARLGRVGARELGVAAGRRDLEQRVGFLRGGARPPTERMIAFVDARTGTSSGSIDLQETAARPADLLRGQGAPTLGENPIGREDPGRDPSGPQGQLRRLRGEEGACGAAQESLSSLLCKWVMLGF